MKSSQYIVCVILSAVVLVLSVTLFFTGRSAQKVQLALQQQQEEISKGQQSLQISQKLLQDLGNFALARTNMRLMKVLNDNGFQIQAKPADAGSTNAAPAPAAAK